MAPIEYELFYCPRPPLLDFPLMVFSLLPTDD